MQDDVRMLPGHGQGLEGISFLEILASEAGYLGKNPFIANARGTRARI